MKLEEFKKLIQRNKDNDTSLRKAIGIEDKEGRLDIEDYIEIFIDPDTYSFRSQIKLYVGVIPYKGILTGTRNPTNNTITNLSYMSHLTSKEDTFPTTVRHIRKGKSITPKEVQDFGLENIVVPTSKPQPVVTEKTRIDEYIVVKGLIERGAIVTDSLLIGKELVTVINIEMETEVDVEEATKQVVITSEESLYC